MNWDPEREERVKRHSLDYSVPRDRQLDSLEVERPGKVILISDTLYVVRCPSCEEEFRYPTEFQATEAFSEHADEEHPQMPKQHELPGWFRSIMQSRVADIAKLQYDHEDHDY